MSINNYFLDYVAPLVLGPLGCKSGLGYCAFSLNTCKWCKVGGVCHFLSLGDTNKDPLLLNKRITDGEVRLLPSECIDII